MAVLGYLPKLERGLSFGEKIKTWWKELTQALKSNFLDFRVLESKFVKFLMSVLKWQVNSSSNFALFFIVMTMNPLQILRSYLFYFGQKDPIKVPILTKCSGENLPNILSLFSNHKSVFLQNLYNFSVSWKITPL